MKKIFQIWLFMFCSALFVLTFWISLFEHDSTAHEKFRVLLNYKINDAKIQYRTFSQNQDVFARTTSANTIVESKMLAQVLENDPALIADRSKMTALFETLDLNRIWFFDNNRQCTDTWPPVEKFEPSKYSLKSQKDNSRSAIINQLFLQKDNENVSLFLEDFSDPLDGVQRNTCAVPFKKNTGFLFVCYNQGSVSRLKKDYLSLDNLSRGFRLGQHGQLVVAGLDGYVKSCEDQKMTGHSIQSIFGTSIWNELRSECQHTLDAFNKNRFLQYRSPESRKMYKCKIFGIEQIAVFDVFPVEKTVRSNVYIEQNDKLTEQREKKIIEWLIIGGLIPCSEIYSARNQVLIAQVFLYIVIFFVSYFLVSNMVQRFVVNGVHELNSTLKAITDGNLDVHASVQTCQELATLSDRINQTVDVLKTEIKTRLARLEYDINLARKIQKATIPNIFPPFPDRHEFDIYGIMEPARDVGGDFFDYAMLDNDHLFFIISDISGNGIPAAMFMMKAKVYCTSQIRTGMALDEVARKTNEHLCQDNTAEMFITAFLGILEISTGKIQYVSVAQHMPLVWSEKTKQISPLGDINDNSTFWGIIPGVEYKKCDVQIEPGSKLILYSDGVTESVDPSRENPYGQNRFFKILNSGLLESSNLRHILETISNDVELFTGGLEQSDDLTLLIIEYRGPKYIPGVNATSVDIS